LVLAELAILEVVQPLMVEDLVFKLLAVIWQALVEVAAVLEAVLLVLVRVEMVEIQTTLVAEVVLVDMLVLAVHQEQVLVETHPLVLVAVAVAALIVEIIIAGQVAAAE
jgi:hypothetical protein